MKKLLNWNKNEDGYTLAAVLLIFIIVSILGMSIIALSVHAMNISSKEHDNQSTFYIAESGATYRLAQIEVLADAATVDMETEINNNRSAYEIGGELDENLVANKFFELFNDELGYNADPTLNHEEIYDEFVDIKGKHTVSKIKVEPVDLTGTSRVYNIISLGAVGDEERTVNLPITMSWNESPDYALLTRNAIKIHNTAATSNVDPTVHGIQGNIGSLEGEIDFYNGSDIAIYLNGKTFVEGVTQAERNAKVKWESDVTNLPVVFNTIPPTLNESNPDHQFSEDLIQKVNNTSDLPKLPTFMNKPGNAHLDNLTITGTQTIDLTSNVTAYNTIDLPNDDSVIVFNVGDQDRIVSVNSLTSKGEIKVQGSKSLILYVDNGLSIKDSRIGNDADIDKLNIYYAGNDIIDLRNGRLSASIYAKQAPVDLSIGMITGNILTGCTGNCFTIGMGAKGIGQLIIAPDADITQTGGDFVGTVVANSLTMTGAGTIKFEKIVMTGPFSLEEVMNTPENMNNSVLQRVPAEPKPGKLIEQ